MTSVIVIPFALLNLKPVWAVLGICAPGVFEVFGLGLMVAGWDMVEVLMV